MWAFYQELVATREYSVMGHPMPLRFLEFQAGADVYGFERGTTRMSLWRLINAVDRTRLTDLANKAASDQTIGDGEVTVTQAH